MRFLGYVLLVVLFIFATLFIVGLCLPRVRKGTKQTVYNASIETVYNTVVNNKDWKWRTSLDNLQIIETNDDFEVWEEISQGSTIRFKTKEKTPAGNTGFLCQAGCLLFWSFVARISARLGLTGLRPANPPKH